MPTGTGFVQAASRYIGTPYVWGGESPRGFDCSGLVAYVLGQMGVQGVPRTSEEQWAWVQHVTYRNVQPGDLVFLNFPGERSPGHVAIYAGRGQVIQAPKPGELVGYASFRPLPAGSSEWGGRVVGYGRVPGLAYASSGRPSLTRPPRPGDPNAPGGNPDPGQAAGDAATGAWAEYARELSPPHPAGGPATEGASLKFFGFSIPGTGWYPSWLPGIGPTPGVPGLDSWNPLHSFDQAAGAVSDVGTFLQWTAWLFSPRNILRVVEALAGAGLIVVGLSFARQDAAGSSSSGPVKRAAKGALLAVPGAGELKAAGAARAAGRKKAARPARTVHHYHPVGSAADERNDRRRRARPISDPATNEIPF